jgi:hypothetical protein
MLTDNAKRESRLRHLAKREGYLLRKSRSREVNVDDFGDFMLVEGDTNLIVLGSRFDATLDDVEAFLAH